MTYLRNNDIQLIAYLISKGKVKHPRIASGKICCK